MARLSRSPGKSSVLWNLLSSFFTCKKEGNRLCILCTESSTWKRPRFYNCTRSTSDFLTRLKLAIFIFFPNRYMKDPHPVSFPPYVLSYTTLHVWLYFSACLGNTHHALLPRDTIAYSCPYTFCCSAGPLLACQDMCERQTVSPSAR